MIISISFQIPSGMNINNSIAIKKNSDIATLIKSDNDRKSILIFKEVLTI